MARKDALLRLHSRLVARRDALRKALNGDLDAYREYAAMNVVGDSVDAAVDTANDEISSQIVEIESRELGQIEHALQRQFPRIEITIHIEPIEDRAAWEDSALVPLEQADRGQAKEPDA